MVKWNSLHNHTVYSKLDGMCDIKSLVKKAKEYGMDSIAITDHGVMSGLIKFYLECTSQGIKPILGTELYLTEDRTIKTKKEMDDNNYKKYHLILYAATDEGLANLYQIASEAANGGAFDGYERLDLKFVRDNNLGKGIICTSACLGGPVSSYLFNSKKGSVNKPLARKWAEDLNNTFEHFYLELGCNSLLDQKLVNQELIQLSNETNIPLIISGDTHYILKEDARYHDILLCMNTNTTLDNPDRFKFPSDDFYLLTPKEVEIYCINNNIPLEAMHNTIKIGEICNANPTPKDKKALLPEFDVPEGYTDDSYLYKLAWDNLLELSLKKPIDYIGYANRLSYELEVICMKGYASYFLILWDIINWCKKKDISTGPGRG